MRPGVFEVARDWWSLKQTGCCRFDVRRRGILGVFLNFEEDSSDGSLLLKKPPRRGKLPGGSTVLVTTVAAIIPK